LGEVDNKALEKASYQSCVPLITWVLTGIMVASHRKRDSSERAE